MKVTIELTDNQVEQLKNWHGARKKLWPMNELAPGPRDRILTQLLEAALDARGKKIKANART